MDEETYELRWPPPTRGECHECGELHYRLNENAAKLTRTNGDVVRTEAQKIEAEYGDHWRNHAPALRWAPWLRPVGIPF